MADIVNQPILEKYDAALDCMGLHMLILDEDRMMYLKNDRTIKFVGLQALRMGLCTEDLAMLIALHIEPDKTYAKPLLDYYFQCLCENVKDYSYEEFINDYKISVAENMFFTIKLMNKEFMILL